MIGKFAAVPGTRVVPVLALFLTILAPAKIVRAQQPPPQPAPAQQPPAPTTETPQSSSQETAEEETIGKRKPKVHDYKNWTFNIGGGASMVGGSTDTFVR